MYEMAYKTMRVYGNKLSSHHKSLIECDIRDRVEAFATWLHLSNIKPVPHEEWKPLFYISPDGTQYHISTLVAKFLSECQNEL